MSLNLDQVGITLGGRALVNGVSVELHPGEVVGLLGPNGAGKTTTFNLVTGLLRPDRGDVRLDGLSVTQLPMPRRARLGIGYLPQEASVFRTLTVRENLEMGALLRRDRPGIARDRDAMYARFPRLAERAQQAAGTLSGGEQQMLAIARALMSRPRLVMFDEPSLGLAPNLVEQVFAIVREVRAEGLMVLMVEQNALAALELCDRAFLLETGRVVREGDGRSLLASDDVREAYLGGRAHAA